MPGGVDYRLQCVGDHGVPALGGVLVAEGSDRGGVAQAGHQLALGGALLGGECSGRVAQIVEVDVGLPDGGSRPAPLGVEGGPPQAFGQWAREHDVVGAGPGVPAEVFGQGVGDRAWEVDESLAGVGLRRGHQPVAVLQFHRLDLDPHLGAVDEYVLAAEAEQLAQAQATEAGQEN